MGGKRVGNSFVLTAKPRDGKDAIYATITKSVGVVECDSSGDTTEEQTVDTYVAIEKGGTAQTLTGIVCKIDDSAELGTSYAAAGTPSPTINFKKSTVLNTGYVKIFIKSGTSFLSPTVIVITVSATVDGVSVSRKVTLTIQGNIHGPEGENGHNGQDGQDGNDAERYWIETGDGTREVRFTADFAGNVSGTPSYVSILLKHLKGSTEETLQSVPSGYTLEYLDDGGNWESFSPGSRNMGSDLSDGSYSPAVYRLRKGATELSRISIRAVWEYQRMLLPAGKYTSKEYTRTPTTTPLVLHEQSGEYWFLVKDTNKVGNSYVGPKDAGQTAWQKADDYDVVLTKMLFALFAKLGGFIAYGFYFLSQYGTLIGPNSETAVRENNVNTEYAGYGAPPYVLNGGSVGNGYIVCKVSFYAQEGDKIGIRLTASSESGYDYGYVGALDDDTFAGMTSAGDILSQSGFMEASGTETVTQQVTIETTGIHYFYITYAKDGSQNKNSDNATFEFSGAEFRIKLVNRYNSNLTLTSASMARVPYGWFDPADPMAEDRPTTGYKFRPMKCINALTGEEWGTNVHLSGEIHATSGEFTGTVRAKNFYHGVCIVYSEEWYYLNYKPTVTLNGDGDIDCSTQSEYDMEMAFWKDYEQGKYYQWTAERKASLYGSPLSNIENSPYTPVFVPCTGPADIVAIPNTANDTGDITIILPCASDFDGKIVEIADTRYTQPSSSYYIGNLLVRQADGSSKMKGSFTGAPTSSLTMNGNYEHNGESHRLLSYEGYWVKLRTS